MFLEIVMIFVPVVCSGSYNLVLCLLKSLQYLIYHFISEAVSFLE